MSGPGYAAMTLGIIFTLVVGCGLMALMFYSSRRGYDSKPRALTEADALRNTRSYRELNQRRWLVRRWISGFQTCRLLRPT